MADYKQIKTLTIDGVTQGMVYDFDGTGQANYTNLQNLRVTTANTWVSGASISITEPGLYMLYADCAFFPSSTTGAVTRACRIFLGDTTAGTQSRQDAGNTNLETSLFAWRYIGSPTTVTIQKRVSVAENSAGRTYIAAKRIYKPL